MEEKLTNMYKVYWLYTSIDSHIDVDIMLLKIVTAFNKHLIFVLHFEYRC